MTANSAAQAAPALCETSGLKLYSGYLSSTTQAELVDIVRKLMNEAPLYRPAMPGSGTPFSVQMTNCGSLGWVSDKTGYRYQAQHPQTGRAWPPIAEEILKVWRAVANYPHAPQACLVNYYVAGAKMGLHVDADEADKAAPVVSISLGDSALFRIGGAKRGDKTRSFKLGSGDVVVLGGASRHFFHGIDRVYTGSSRLLPEGGRLNLTLRCASAPPN